MHAALLTIFVSRLVHDLRTPVERKLNPSVRDGLLMVVTTYISEVLVWHYS